MSLGLVCDACDALSAATAVDCSRCGAPFAPSAADVTPTSASPALATPVEPESQAPAEPDPEAETVTANYLDMGATLHDAPLLEALRSASAAVPAGPVAEAVPPSGRRCANCGAGVVSGHKFCGECGHRVEAPASSAARHTMYQRMVVDDAGRARLVLIRGEGSESLSYHLAGTEHVVGRVDGEILFPDDPLVSPRHANFFYREGELHVRDEGSRNGVFLRIRGPVRLSAGQPFLVGEQLLAVQPANVEGLSAADTEGTYYYGSPRRPARIRMVQLLAGGDLGMAIRVPGDLLSIGREGNSVNFPEDPFISGHHAQVVPLDDGSFRLSDVGSKNGTFIRIADEMKLAHGDFVFLGQQLLRVEIV